MPAEVVPGDTEARDEVLTTADVAQLFKTEARTVARWAREHKLPSFRTPGGQLRFRGDDVRPLLATGQIPEAAAS